jgi:putative membrane protein
MFKLIRFLLGIVIALLGAAFAYLNPDEVGVNYYFGTLQLPLGVLILGLLGAGMVIGAAASLLPLVRARRQTHRMERRANVADRELQNLRTMPVKDR